MLWVLFCKVYLTVCSHVTYAFQSESILYSCLNVKELLARKMRDIWNLGEWNGTRTRNHLVRKRVINWAFTLKRVRDMIRTYTQLHRADKYSEHSSIIWPVWLNGWVFVYELSGCGFQSCCSHLNFRYRPCFEQGVPWNSSNYRVWIYSETRTWHDNNWYVHFVKIWQPSLYNLRILETSRGVWQEYIKKRRLYRDF